MACFARVGATLVSLAILTFPSISFGQRGKIDPLSGGLSFPPAVGSRIDDSGTVIGTYSLIPTQPQAMRWTRAGGVQLLTPLATQSPFGSARGMSADGSTIVGHATYRLIPRAFRWTAADGSLPLESLAGFAVSYANAVSADGSIIVGVRSETATSPLRAFRWTEQTGMVDLGSIDGGAGTSGAEDISADGSVVVGVSQATEASPQRAFRWTSAGMQSLGTIGGVTGESYAWAVSPNGTIVVGGSTTPDLRYRGFVYSTMLGAMEELPTIGDYVGDSVAYSISADGRVVAGMSTSSASPAGEACVWIDRVPYSLSGLLQSCGIDMRQWTLKQCRCSPDGTRFTGEGTFQGRTMGFSVGVWPDAEPLQIASDVTQGSTQYAEIGLPYRATFVVTDPEGGDLAFSVTGLPVGATVDPPTGTTGPSPLTIVLEWTPEPTEFGRGGVPYLSFADERGAVAVRSFGLFGRQNQVPTVEPLEPQRVECIDGVHEVDLAALVADGNGHPLTVTWSVDGEVELEETGVASGTEVHFEHDYDHGAYDVEVRVSDGYSAIAARTIVTIEDTAAPIFFAAPDVIAETDAGEAFASNVTLIEPTVSDASGHAVTLENDAPATYPLGQTMVTWTATDEAGHVAEAEQRVIVEDREMPVLDGVASMRVFVDPGKIFSKARLPLPRASDNVTDPSEIQVASDAPGRFSVGDTVVTFRATDGAGNVAESRTTVTVVNRRPKADAGSDLHLTAKTDRGVRASLDGSASSDPDQQKLTFDWSAAGIVLNRAQSQNPTALFPVGVTRATLTVTDPAGASRTDQVRVVVKRANARPRPNGRAANAAFAQAERQAKYSVASGSGGGEGLIALSLSSAATRLGEAIGDEIRWNDDSTGDAATLTYIELRSLQSSYGQAAARSLLAAYADSGDESLIVAVESAMEGTAAAQADVVEP